jgi:hypothetical protein
MNRFELISCLEEEEKHDKADEVIKDIIYDLDRKKMEKYIFDSLDGLSIHEIESILRGMK